jgi:NDP-sugar pyrophosphorylase family protein
MPKHILILAGDQASRLQPRRTSVPAPLMPVGDRPVLELMLRHAARHGFTDVTLAVGELAPLIRAMFGDGGRLGVSISYGVESERLGAGGALRLFAPDEPFLLVSGNALTTLDLRDFHAAHMRSDNAVTIATHRRDVPADFRVLQLGDDAGSGTTPVERYVERPRTTYAVSTGVYAVQPDVREHILAGEHIGLPALVERLTTAGRRVGAFEHDALSVDVRRRDEYEQAIAYYEEIAPSFSDPAERQAA